MATEKSAQAILNANFECSVCRELFQDPRMLSCGHTFCLKCLQDILHAAVRRSGNASVDKIPCPECRTQFSVGSQNLQDLPKNYIVAAVIPSLPANSQCDNTVFCEIHPNKKVKFHCDTCQRFVCSTCTGVICKQHTVLELPDAESKFTTELKATLEPLQAISSNLDRAIKDITSDITLTSSHRDIVQDRVEKVLSQTETKLKALFEQLLARLKQFKNTAKLTISKLHSEHVDKLKISLADTQKRAHNIQQQKAAIEQHLASKSSVFEKYKVVKQLSEIQNVASQAQAKLRLPETNMYDTSKWQNDMTAWLHDMSGALTTATTRLPQLTLQPLVKHSPTRAHSQVKSMKHKSNFTLNPTNGRPVTVLSVSNEGQLLVGQSDDRHQLHVYNADCCHVTSIKLPGNDKVCNAVWTRRGNIIYSEWRSGNVVTISQSSVVIQQTKVSRPGCLSVSTDGVIYLTKADKSVYQSTDDGLTWSHIFNVTDNWECWQVIKVSTDSNTDVLWTVVRSKEDWHLRVYTVDKRRAVSDNFTWCDVSLPTHVTIDLSYSKLAYNGHTSIFVTDISNRAVHEWSLSGRYICQLVSPQQLISNLCRIAVDTQRHVMYVGYEKGKIGVFELT